ncbi:TPA: heme ABC transporter ATP-binding protein [Photobacterium damselae]
MSSTLSSHHAIALKASNLHLQLGGKTLLDNVDLEIMSGQITALLGPNGAGKSSLLKVLNGEITPNSGAIEIFSKPKDHWPSELLAKHMGILPQHSTLSFSFLAHEVAELGAMPLAISNHQAQQLAAKNMVKVGVDHLANRLYPTLSGGEKQRVHFARVLTQLSHSGEQCILMLDEPTSALDLAHQHHTLEIAQALSQQGAAVIIVIHDLNLAAQYADRLIILNQGKIQADGTPWQVLTPTAVENVYGWPVQVIAHPEHNYPVILA